MISMKTFFAAIVLFTGTATAQVYAYFPADPATLSYWSDYKSNVKGLPSVAGITVVIPWASYDNGNDFGPSVDTGTL
jgi:hypothetical protein